MRYERNIATSTARNTKVESDQDIEHDFAQGSSVAMFNKPIVINSVDAYLDGDIRNSAYYRELLQYMRTMEEGDELRLWIDTRGGDLDGAMQIVDAMQTCQGEVVCIVTGRAQSAGSLIALSAPNLLVGENATFMCHAASYGIGGKQNEVQSKFLFNTTNLDKIIRKGYKHFLSDDEIDSMLDGKDFWFDSEETKLRLERRLQYQEQEAAAKALSALDEKLTQGKPKRKPKATKLPD